nr:MAG TPA: hypothetical protein [Caudoviricetes sp.]
MRNTVNYMQIVHMHVTILQILARAGDLKIPLKIQS